MSPTIFGLVLLAAALHAAWNAIVRGAGDKFFAMALVAGWAAGLSLVAIPFLPIPARASWPFIAASTFFHLAYYALVAGAYRYSDMSRAYPLMRGTAPLLVALVSALTLGEHLTAGAWLGIALICGGILAMATETREAGHRGLALALANAIVIAGYTLLDGFGSRLSGTPTAYALWLFALSGLPLALWAAQTQRADFAAFVKRSWHLGLAGGAGTLVAYVLVLWAMSFAPIPVVAALRETAILFGTAISGLILKERIGPARLAAAGLIAAGAIALRLA